MLTSARQSQHNHGNKVGRNPVGPIAISLREERGLLPVCSQGRSSPACLSACEVSSTEDLGLKVRRNYSRELIRGDSAFHLILTEHRAVSGGRPGQCGHGDCPQCPLGVGSSVLGQSVGSQHLALILPTSYSGVRSHPWAHPSTMALRAAPGGTGPAPPGHQAVSHQGFERS